MNRNDNGKGSMADTPREDRPDMEEWEAQVNALLDGELDDARADALKSAAEADQALACAIIEAYQLQRLMTSMPVERAPDSLREKLRRIPAEQASLERRRAAVMAPPRRTAWFAPRWAMALAAVPLVIAVGVQLSGPRSPSEAELAQARQDLSLAFSYLAKASRATEREIEHSIGAGMRDPVTESTVRTLNEQFDLNEEQES
jgi:anti-sigma factor RsiW